MMLPMLIPLSKVANFTHEKCLIPIYFPLKSFITKSFDSDKIIATNLASIMYMNFARALEFAGSNQHF